MVSHIICKKQLKIIRLGLVYPNLFCIFILNKGYGILVN
jgi:hypothetical protein